MVGFTVLSSNIFDPNLKFLNKKIVLNHFQTHLFFLIGNFVELFFYERSCFNSTFDKVSSIT